MRNIVAKLIDLLQRARLSGVDYARWRGAKVGEGCRILTRWLGSEPFLIEIGDRVTVASNVAFLTHDGATWLLRDGRGRKQHYAPITIGDDCFIGFGAILMPGVEIGDRVIVGAGSVVTHSVPAGSVVAGNPAQRICSFDEWSRQSFPHDADATGETREQRVRRGNNGCARWCASRGACYPAFVRKLAAMDAVLTRHGIRPKIWRRRSDHVFAGLNLAGKSVLDIGSGVGWSSYYAAARGARRVVSIEPEADGSHYAMLVEAEAIRDELGFRDIVEIVPRTIEAAGLTERFDVVLMIHSVNHIDERSCIELDRNSAAWDTYKSIMAAVADLCAPDGHLVATDCTNRNLFGDFGLRSPLLPTIEWEKHQPPAVWVKLLREVGFANPEIAWTPHARLGALGQALSAHPLLAYMFNSHFRLTMRKSAHADAPS